MSSVFQRNILGRAARLLLEELVQAAVGGIFHPIARSEDTPTTEPVPERLSVKNTHQNTSTTEMPVQIPNAPTSTVGPRRPSHRDQPFLAFPTMTTRCFEPCGARQNAAVEIMQTMRRSKTRSEAARKRCTTY